jgi:transcription factor E
MQINYLKKVVESVAGITAVKIVDLLYNKKDINEFLIAKKLGLTINQTRNLLYKLSHTGILSSIRRKDKRKGWYIYFWTFDVLKSLEFLQSSLSNEINQLKGQLGNKQTKRFYKCKMCGREVNEETALLNNFTCTECGEIYELADNAEAVQQISKNITRLEKELELVNFEISKENETKQKKLHKFLKREEKKKKELRIKNRARNKKLKLHSKDKGKVKKKSKK